MEDAEKWRDEYFLLIYAIDEKESPWKKDLAIVENDTYQALNRLELGNISFNRAQLQPFIDEDNASGNKFIKLCILVLVNTENMFLIKSWLLQNHSETFHYRRRLKAPRSPAPPAPGTFIKIQIQLI